MSAFTANCVPNHSEVPYIFWPLIYELHKPNCAEVLKATVGNIRQNPGNLYHLTWLHYDVLNGWKIRKLLICVCIYTVYWTWLELQSTSAITFSWFLIVFGLYLYVNNFISHIETFLVAKLIFSFRISEVHYKLHFMIMLLRLICY
jgi:hypothetical protein